MAETKITENNIAYQQYGEVGNPDLVLLHSGGMSKAEWQPFLRHWQTDFHLTCFDLPGHAESAPAALSVQHFAEVIGEAIQAVIPGNYALLGSSLGAAVGLTHALTRPDGLVKYIHYRMGYRKTLAASESIEDMASPTYWRQYGLDKMLQGFHRLQAQFREQVTAETAWEQVIADVPTLMSMQTTTYQHSLEDLAAIAIPVMLIVGDQDPIVPVTDVMDMYQAIPDSALWVMPGASHITAANTWRKNSFVDEVSRFVKG